MEIVRDGGALRPWEPAPAAHLGAEIGPKMPP